MCIFIFLFLSVPLPNLISQPVPASPELLVQFHFSGLSEVRGVFFVFFLVAQDVHNIAGRKSLSPSAKGSFLIILRLVSGE